MGADRVALEHAPGSVAGGKKIRAVDLFEYLLARCRYHFFRSGEDSSRAEAHPLEPGLGVRLSAHPE